MAMRSYMKLLFRVVRVMRITSDPATVKSEVGVVQNDVIDGKKRQVLCYSMLCYREYWWHTGIVSKGSGC